MQLNSTMRLISGTLPHISCGFHFSPTLNCQPYIGRLPLTSWWRKLSIQLDILNPLMATIATTDSQKAAAAGLATN